MKEAWSKPGEGQAMQQVMEDETRLLYGRTTQHPYIKSLAQTKIAIAITTAKNKKLDYPHAPAIKLVWLIKLIPCRGTTILHECIGLEQRCTGVVQ